jgi:hypothetical protein
VATVDISSSNYGITFRITYTQTSDVATNKSVVSITKVQVKSNSYTGQYYLDGDIAINGTTVANMTLNKGQHKVNINGTGTYYGVSGTFGSITVEHDDVGDASATFALKTVQGWLQATTKKWTVSGSKTVELNRIPRVSTFQVADGVLGVEQDITVTRQDESFSHTITYKCGVAEGTVCEKSTEEVVKFTPPLELAKQNTSGKELTITYKLQTYSGDEAIGSEVPFTAKLTIPDSVVPVCTLDFMDASGHVSRFGGYVQNQTKLLVSVLGTPAYYSPIVSYETKIGERVFTDPTFTTTLQEVGEVRLSAKVTDDRGATSEEVADTITVLPYALPKIEKLAVHRCDEVGEENFGGSYAKVTFSYVITPLNSLNSKTVTLYYKKSTDDDKSWIPVPMDYGYKVENVEYIFSADDGSSYDVYLEVADSFTGTNPVKLSTSVSTADVIMHFRADAKGMGIGKVSEQSNALDMGWDIELNDNRILQHGVPVEFGGGSGDAPSFNEIANWIYPVGSIYMSVSEISPATLFGGEWEQLKDRFLLGAGDTYTAGDEDGEAEHTLTIEEMPAHTHSSNSVRVTEKSGGSAAMRNANLSDLATDVSKPEVTSAGGGAAHNNMPPYLAVYMWKRTK